MLFRSDDTPIVRGSALKALEEPNGEWADKIVELMEEVDKYIPEPKRDNDKPFLMPVEDVFSITGRETVATGRVERVCTVQCQSYLFVLTFYKIHGRRYLTYD